MIGFVILAGIVGALIGYDVRRFFEFDPQASRDPLNIEIDEFRPRYADPDLARALRHIRSVDAFHEECA